MNASLNISLFNNIELYNELSETAKSWNCSVIEAARDLLFDHFSAAGFDEDILQEELDSYDDDEIIRIFCDNFNQN